MKELITIQISTFLTNELAEKIAQKQWQSSAPTWVNRSRLYIFDELLSGNDCFGVVATTASGEMVGRLHCVKNETDPFLWYYGDLFVVPEYRRLGAAKQMIHTAIGHLAELGAKTLRCYVEPDNLPSRNLQRSTGFTEKKFASFNHFINDGETMYEIDIPNCLTMIPATFDEAYFVRILFAENRDDLHAENIRLDEWKEILSAKEPDQKHFLIYKGAVPAAYIRISGLLNKREAGISMLFVAKAFQHQGLGSFAIDQTTSYLQEKGFQSIAVQIDTNNLPARNCFLKCGYQIIGHNIKITLRKTLCES